MNIVEITANEDVMSLARKCNRNFRQIGSAITRIMNMRQVPSVGAYVLMDTTPEMSYPGTVWTQVDSVMTLNSLPVPLWQRTD